MNAATATAVTPFVPPTRLTLPVSVGQRFNIDPVAWKALVEAIYPNATSVDSVVMALSYCEARKLDPFKKPVHIVPVWSTAANKMVDTVWPGISELRTTAMRTGLYAGKEKTVFGPMITKDLGGVEVTFPEWAQVTVYRMVEGAGRCAFEGPQVFWLESYATAKRDTMQPNAMWRRRAIGQIDKCAEAAALRTAFPEEIGGEYAAEEMEGQAFGAPIRDVTPKPSGMADRLAAGVAPAAEGFNGARAEREGYDADGVIDAEIDDDGFPGDLPAADAAQPRDPAPPPKSGTQALGTVASRIDAFKARCNKTPNVKVLREIGVSAETGALVKAIDAADPEEVGTSQDLENWFNELVAKREGEERAAAEGGNQ